MASDSEHTNRPRSPQQAKGRKWPIVVLLLGVVTLALALTACGGEPSTSTPGVTSGGQSPEPTATPTAPPTTSEAPAPAGRLTLEETGAWCTQFDERFVEKLSGLEESWGNLVEVYEWLQDEIASVNPPEELQEFWDAWQRHAAVIVSLAKEKPAGEEIGEFRDDSEVHAAKQAWRATAVALAEASDRKAYDVALDCYGY